MKRRLAVLAAPAACLAGCAAPTPRAGLAGLQQQVTATELAFAATMAARDHAAFVRFLSAEAVFLNGGKPLRGKAAVAEHWRRFFTAPTAPFSWKPDLVQVLDSGALAQSIGPVSAPNGKVVARVYSTWRLEEPSVWRIVFDDGYDVCECPEAGPAA